MAYKFQVGAAQLDGATTFEKALVGESTISGSGVISGLSLDIEKGADFNDGGLTNAGAVSGVSTLDASGLASLDGGININDDFTVNTDGAVVAVGINAGGALSGVTTLAASGLASVASISMDDGSTLGPDSVAGLWTFSADGDTTQANGAYDFDLASHDGTNGLKLGGVLVDASAADLNFTNVAAAGTAEASKAVVLDASKNIATLGTVGCGALTSTGASTMGSLNIGGTLACDTSFTIDAVVLNATELGFVDGVTAGTAIASKAVVLDASKDVTGINNLTASYFAGNGSGITNIDVSNLDAAGSDKFLQFNQDGEFAGNAGLQYNGTGSIVVSGSSSGYQTGELAFGTEAQKVLRVRSSYDGGYYGVIEVSNGGLDLSASAGVTAMVPDGEDFTVANGVNAHSAIVMGDMEGNKYAYMSGSGVISGSQSAQFKGLYVGDGNFTVSKLGALTISNSLASLDGGINVNDAFTVSTAGAVVGNEFKTDGNEFVVSTAGLVTATGIANSSAGMTAVGSIAGATTVSGSGAFNIGGTLNADNLGSVAVALSADMMVIDDAASGQIRTTSLANYSTAIAGAGLLSTAGVIAVVNNTNGGIAVAADAISIDLSDLSAAAVNVAADSFAFLDADGDVTQKESIADLATAMAGTGITATAGVFSLTSVSTPTSFGSYATLVEGLNFANVTLTGSTVLTLPAASALEDGEFVKIKLAAGASSTNFATVSVGDGSDTIDGAASITLESPFAAVDLYRVAANTWRIL